MPAPTIVLVHGAFADASGFRGLYDELLSEDVTILAPDRATRYTADRRWPVDNTTFCYAVAVHQVQASRVGSGTEPGVPNATAARVLEPEELTILTAWADEGTLDGWVRQVLLSLLEERRTREPTQVNKSR
jgi:hypothetical protein